MSEFNQEELDEKIMNEIREKSENLEIPESLSPENMMKRINEQKVKKGRFNNRVRVITTVLAASLVLVVGVGIYGKVSNGSNSNLATIDSDVNASKNEGSKLSPAFDSYDELYKELKKESEYSGMIFNSAIDVEADGIVEEDMEYLGSEGEVPKGDSSSDDEDYTGTNLQVEGVDEGDIIKTDGKNIFVYDTYTNIIRIIEADGNESKIVAEIDNKLEDCYSAEMYLCDDKLVFVYSEGYWSDYSYVLTYDISDVCNPREIGRLKQEGSIHSTRLVDGKLYMFTNVYVPYDLDEDNCVPIVGEEKVSCDDIYKCGSSYGSYIVIASVDINKPDRILDVKSILTNDAYIYVSENNIYILGEDTEEKGKYVNILTSIIKIEYRDGVFVPIAEGNVKGRIRDQFSIDEYDGTVRVLTTSYMHRNYNQNFIEDFVEDIVQTPDRDMSTTNNVYVLDEGLNVIGSIEGLAKGERIYSARFDGDMGYFVTFRETDPVFAVDFSDKTNPKILGELKVSGFSEYLHMWSDNLMIGIGEEVDENTGERLGIKISMFDVSDPENMVEVDKVLLDGQYSQTLYNHKALLINPEKNLIGLDVENYVYEYLEDIYVNEYNEIVYSEESYSNTYYIFSYDEVNGFSEITNKAYADDELDYVYQTLRGVHIGDYVYIINASKEISVYDIKNKEVSSVIEF